jgi:hypothetical protein
MINISAIICIGLIIYYFAATYESPNKKWARYEANKEKYPDNPFKWDIK